METFNTHIDGICPGCKQYNGLCICDDQEEDDGKSFVGYCNDIAYLQSEHDRIEKRLMELPF